MNKQVGDLKPEVEVTLDPLELLRRPFPANQISKLPKPTAKRETMDTLPKANCSVCGGYHATSRIIHLDYVGHAALTDRLLDVDPHWTWEPVAYRDGLPALDANGGLWIKLTICGVTRLGYGSADGKKGGDAVKELIGDALRNAAMRFGAALDLWHKGDLHVDADDDKPADPTKTTGGQAPQTPTLAQRADRVEGAMRQAPDEASVRKAYALASKVCAELSEHDPARLAQVEQTFAECLAKFAPPPAENDLGIGDDEVPY